MVFVGGTGVLLGWGKQQKHCTDSRMRGTGGMDSVLDSTGCVSKVRVIQQFALRSISNLFGWQLFGAALLADLTFKIWIVLKFPFVGVSDYASYSTVARNLLSGKGFSVDWVNFYFYLQPSLHHPEDIWPLLQPIWIALSYLVLGVNSIAAKVPSLMFGAALAMLVFHEVKSLSNQRVACLTALVLMTSPMFFYASVWPSADMGFALLTFGVLALAFRAVHASSPRQATLLALGACVLAGLATEQKIQGMLLLGVLPIWFLIGNVSRLLAWRIKMAAAAVVVIWIGIIPLVIRNYVTFGELGFLHQAHLYEAIVMNGGPQFKMEEWSHYGYLRYDLHPELASAALNRSAGQKLLDRIRKTVSEVGKLARGMQRGRLMFPVLMVFVVIGCLAARGREISFLLLSGVMSAIWLSLLFISHYEHRHQLPVIMVAAVFAGIGLDYFARLFHGARRAGYVAFILMLLGLSYGAAVRAELGYVRYWNRNTEVFTTAEVLRHFSEQRSVVMGVNPMETSYHVGVPTVSIPAGPWSDVHDAMVRYGVTHLVLRYDTQDPTADIWYRPVFDPLYRGCVVVGFEELFRRPWKTEHSFLAIFRVHLNQLPSTKTNALLCPSPEIH